MDVAAALSEQGIKLRSYDMGEHKTTCPRCSAQRKKKHEPCLNVRLDVDGGAVWQCWHCGWTGSTQTNRAASRGCSSCVLQKKRKKRKRIAFRTFSYSVGYDFYTYFFPNLSDCT